MGRLLFTLWLCQQKILSQPVFYLSYYFKRNRTEYYDHLMAIRHDGKWEEWIKFFLKGVTEIANESSDSAWQIDALREEATGLINSLDAQTAVNARKLLYPLPAVYHATDDTARHRGGRWCECPDGRGAHETVLRHGYSRRCNTPHHTEQEVRLQAISEHSRSRNRVAASAKPSGVRPRSGAP
jgi:hypothetical protein